MKVYIICSNAMLFYFSEFSLDSTRNPRVFLDPLRDDPIAFFYCQNEVIKDTNRFLPFSPSQVDTTPPTPAPCTKKQKKVRLENKKTGA